MPRYNVEYKNRRACFSSIPDGVIYERATEEHTPNGGQKALFRQADG